MIAVKCKMKKGPIKVVDFKCKRCGRCCNRFTVRTDAHEDSLWNIPSDADERDVALMRAIFIPIEALEGREDRQWYRCSMLHEKDGVFSCLIYDSRPKICREFEPGCSTCYGNEE